MYMYMYRVCVYLRPTIISVYVYEECEINTDYIAPVVSQLRVELKRDRELKSAYKKYMFMYMHVYFIICFPFCI